MASRKFDLEINVKSKKAEKDLKKFNKTLDDTNKKTKDNKKGNDKAKGGLAGFVGGLSTGTKVLGGIGIALGAATAAVGALNSALLTSATAIRELETMAMVADTSVATMQALSLEAQKFGVSGDKMADIIQDVNDKLGDFVETGAGPFQDFFEKIGPAVGITAEELLALPGPEKIVRIKDALEQYGASSEQAAFHAEALGSDLNRLLPIFENAGEAFRETEARLAALGAVVSKEDRDAIKDYADEVSILTTQWETLKDSILAEIAPALKVLVVNAQEFVAWMQGTVSPNRTLEQLKTDLVEVNDLIDKTNKVSTVGSFRGAEGVQVENPAYTAALKEREEIQARINALLKEASDKELETAERKKKANDIVNEGLQKQLDAQKKIRDDIESGLETRLRLANDLNGSYAFGLDVARDMTVENKNELEYLKLKLTLEDKEVSNAQELLDLLVKTQKVESETARLNRFATKEQSLKRELALLRATTDEQRERLSFEHELFDLDLSGNQKAALTALNEQIMAREKHLEILEKEKDAVQSLAEAMGRWASGSKDAIKQVIAELIRLVAIRAFGGTGSFLGGFLSGFGDGGVRGFADGGQFSAGETFMVGERGPEIITASAPGAVIPNHQLGGGGFSISPQLVINGGVNSVDELGTMFTQFSDEIAVQTQTLIKTQLGPRGVFA